MTENIKNVHVGHRARMRNRFENTRGKDFQDHELLEMLLFYAIPRGNTNDTAHLLLQKFGSLEGVLSSSIEELSMVKGIGRNSAILIKTAFELHIRMLCDTGKDETYTTYDEIGEYLLKLFLHIREETVILLLFNKKGKIIKTTTLATGDGDRAPIDMKKLVTVSAMVGASSAVIAHNHPSGRAEPSFDDRVVTLQVEEILRSLGIKLVEQYIIAEGIYSGVKHSNLIK